MSAHTQIAWTERTWNPSSAARRSRRAASTATRKRCTTCGTRRISAASSRTSRNTPKPFETVQTLPARLGDPLGWRKPSRVFVNSMSDLFHEDVPDVFLDRVFLSMALAPQHTFQVLTKRPKRMAQYMGGLGVAPAERLSVAAFEEYGEEADCTVANIVNGYSWWRTMPPRDVPLDGTHQLWPLPNVWLGVSVENQAAADERIPLLLQTPAAVRFLSCEPLLGEVNLGSTSIPFPLPLLRYTCAKCGGENRLLDPVCQMHGSAPVTFVGGVDWVIVGGESGKGARPMNLEWARLLRDQCLRARVPFFLKQLGGIGDSRSHDKAQLDGQTYTEFPPRDATDAEGGPSNQDSLT
jgi:protein gp37